MTGTAERRAVATSRPLLKSLKELCKLRRDRLEQFDPGPGLRVSERKLLCMQKESVEFLDRFFYFAIGDRLVTSLVVGRVTDDRMIDRRKMDADLMRASGLDLDIEERKFLEPLS